MEADPRHVKEVIRALGLEGASPAPTPGVAAKGETRVEDNEDNTDPELGREETTMFRARPARHYVRHHEAVLKDVSAGRTRLEEHEESGRFLVGRPRVGCQFIQVPCTPLLTRIGQETDNQESQSAEA